MLLIINVGWWLYFNTLKACLFCFGLLNFADKHDSFFTLEIHHKGVFVGSGVGKCYNGGIIDYFDYCNMDLMSILEIEDMLEQLGYDGTVDSYYKMGESTATWGGGGVQILGWN